jgi:hypothetical protein
VSGTAHSGPVCPGIALLFAHCLAARPLPPAHALGDGAKAPGNRQYLPILTPSAGRGRMGPQLMRAKSKCLSVPTQKSQCVIYENHT